MKLHNIRYGFATNSSSSHSIVLFENDHIPIDKDSDLKNQDYGFNQFTLISEEAKRVYIGQCLKTFYHNRYNLSLEESAILASHLIGKTINPNGGIDHQSMINFPLSKNIYYYPSISKEFLNDFIKYMMNPRIGILGGSDSGDIHPLSIDSKPVQTHMYRFFNENNDDIFSRYDSS
jgi:hypothetical protein